MCILIAKHAGVRKPSADELRNSAAANPDGCGMAWVYKKKLYCTKTRDVNDIIALNERIDERQPAIYHFRIATHGTVNLNNCHPFVSGDKKIAFAHNGVLPIRNNAASDWTDSETAFRFLFLPILKTYPIDSKEFKAAVDCIIECSKFAFLESNETLTTFGNYINDDGLLFSNASYLPKPTFGCMDFWKQWEANSSAEADEGYADAYNQQYDSCYGELESELVEMFYNADVVTSQELVEYTRLFYNDTCMIYDLLSEEDIIDMSTGILNQYGIKIKTNGQPERIAAAQV